MFAEQISCARRELFLAGTCLACSCFGCGAQPIIDKRWPDAYWRKGSYVLIAIDTEAQMDLSFDHGGELISLVGPTVFAVGADAHYVVVKQHPSAGGTQFDPAITNYFILDRARETGGRPVVHGPLSRDEFDRLSARLSLPAFDKTFAALEWQKTGQ